MTKRKKLTILILIGTILIGGGVLGWAIKSGKIKPRADVAGAQVPTPTNLAVVNPPTQSFNDVPPEHWAYKYFEAAVQAGIISPGGNVGSDLNYINRRELAIYAVKAEKISISNCNNWSQSFSDVSRTTNGFCYIEAALRNGLFNGASLDTIPTDPYSTYLSCFRNTPGGYCPSAISNQQIALQVVYNVSGRADIPSDFHWRDYTIHRIDDSQGTTYGQFFALLSYNLRLPFDVNQVVSPVLLDWDEPQVDGEYQEIGYQIWRKSPGYSTPIKLFTIDTNPILGEGVDDATSGGRYYDVDFPANAEGQYTYYVCAIDREGLYSGSADGKATTSGLCYNPVTLTLTVSTQTVSAAADPFVTITPTPTSTPTITSTPTPTPAPTPTPTPTKAKRKWWPF